MRKGQRRSKGEGAVFRRPDGTWVAQVDLGWIDGRRRRKAVYAKTERAVLAKRDVIQAQHARGFDLATPPRTLADWLDEWITVVKVSDGTAPATRARYEQVVRVHLVPRIGAIRLGALTPRHVQVLLLELRGGKAAPATIIKVHGVLRNALADAERMDLVQRNVAKSGRGCGAARFWGSAGRTSTSAGAPFSSDRRFSGSTEPCELRHRRRIERRDRCPCRGSPSPPYRRSARDRHTTGLSPAQRGTTTTSSSRPRLAPHSTRAT
jgi:hypothetical protein